MADDQTARVDNDRPWWSIADAKAAERGVEPPSARARTVERVAWAIHAARGLGSPRQVWAAMSDEERAELFVGASAALDTAEFLLARERTQEPGDA